MPANDLQLLITAAQEAGQIAAKFWQKNPEAWDKPGGHGPVTEADLEIDRMLHSTLTAARPDYGWLSEETEDGTERLALDRTFIVDPIDGTRSFMEGSKSFSHSLAIAENGNVTAAVVYLPMLDRLYSASLGFGAKLNDAPLTASAPADESDAVVLAAKPQLRSDYWPGGIPEVTRSYRPSLAYRLALVGQGRFDGMVTLRPSWEWDIAAGALIVSEAGGVVSDGHGQPLQFNNATPQVPGVIAAGAPLHRSLLKRRLLDHPH